jgi:hypothetical protein
LQKRTQFTASLPKQNLKMGSTGSSGKTSPGAEHLRWPTAALPSGGRNQHIVNGREWQMLRSHHPLLPLRHVDFLM